VSRRRLARFAAPAAFLAALTLAVLLIRSGLQGGRPATTPTVTQAATTSPVRTTRRPRRTTTAATTGTTSAAAVYYTVQSGDTFGSIAARFGTSVQRLEALNPGTSSTALTVGQKIRVK
jgi:LysM repeat protein